MTWLNTQAAECLSRLSAELDTGIAMDLQQALKWADKNTQDGVVERLKSRKVAQVLALNVRRLQAVIEQEAQYCYGWAASAEMMGDDDRAKRHRERGDRLMSSV